MKNIAKTLLILSTIFCVAPFGCSKKVSSESSQKTDANGNTEKHESKVTRDNDGNVTKTTEDSVHNKQ